MLHLKISEGANYNQWCLQRTGVNLKAGETNTDSSLVGRPFISIIGVFKAISQPYSLLEEKSFPYHLSEFLAVRWHAARWLKQFLPLAI